MRQRCAALLQLLPGLLMFGLCASAGPMLSQFQVTPLGGSAYRYSYAISGDILQYQAIEFQFSAGNYITLSNQNVPNADWDGLVFQPNSPVGADGVWSLLALVGNPSLAGLFTIDFDWGGPGLPAQQLFVVNQYDALGNFIAQVAQGETVPMDGPVTTPVPEPTTLSFVAIGLGALAHRLRRAASR